MGGTRARLARARVLLMPLPYLIERFVAEYLANQGSSRPMKITHSRDLLATAPACTLAALGLIITAIPAGAAETTPNVLFILVGNQATASLVSMAAERRGTRPHRHRQAFQRGAPPSLRRSRPRVIPLCYTAGGISAATMAA